MLDYRGQSGGVALRKLPFLLLLLVFYWPQSIAAADETAFLSAREGPHHFTPDDKEARTRIRLIAGDAVKTADSIGLTIAEVSHDGTVQAALQDAITIPATLEADEHGLYFIEPVLDLAAIPGKRHGSYVVTLVASASLPGENDDDPPTELTQTLDLPITYPKIEMEAPDNLLIEETCFFGHNCSTMATKLNLEAKGSVGPADLRIVQTGHAMHGDKPVPGTVEAETPADRSDLQQLAVNIAVPFPRGDTTGKLRISSPEIDRMSVNFTVQRRDGLVALGIVVLVGLAAGLFLRTNLESGLQRRRREVTLKTLQRRVFESGAGIGDKVLQEKLDEIASEVEDQIKDRAAISDADLKTKVTGWETALKTALDTSASSAGETETALEALYDLVRANWTAPVAIQDVLENSQVDLDVIRQQLRDRNYDDASTQLDSVQVELHGTLVKSTQEWRTEVNDTIARLGNTLKAPLPKDTVPDFKPIDTDLSTKISSVEVNPGDKPNDSIKAVLTAGHEALNATNQLLYNLRRELDATAAGVTRILGNALGPIPAAALETARGHLAAFKPDDWTEAAVGRRAELTKLLSDVTAAMAQAVRSVRDPVSDDVTNLLAAGQYIQAAAEALKQPAPSGEALERLPRAASRTGAPVARDDTSLFLTSPHGHWVDTREPALRLAHTAGHRAVRIERLRLETVETARQIAWREALQTGVAWVGLTIVGVFIFQDSFVGTYQDYVKVFLWGFTTDAGVGTFLERVKTKVL